MSQRHSGLRVTATAAAIAVAACFLAGPALGQPAPSDLTSLPPVVSDYQPTRTAWGDPDLRGTWPINDVAELPVSRPDQYGNRFFKTDEEMAQEAERAQDLETRYDKEDQEDTIGTGHWIEYLAGQRRTSMVIDPISGKLPAMTRRAKRFTGTVARAGSNTSFNWVTDFDSWDRCISRGFRTRCCHSVQQRIRLFQAPGYVVIPSKFSGPALSHRQ